MSSSRWGGVRVSIHAPLSKAIFAEVDRVLLPGGGPKNVVREPCLSLFGAEGEPTAAEIEEAAFRFTFMLSASRDDRRVELINSRSSFAGRARGLQKVA